MLLFSQLIPTIRNSRTNSSLRDAFLLRVARYDSVRALPNIPSKLLLAVLFGGQEFTLENPD